MAGVQNDAQHVQKISVLGPQEEIMRLTGDVDGRPKFNRKEVYRRWNILIRKAMHRIRSMKAQDNLERWKRLLKSGEQAGHFSLKTFESKSDAVLRRRKE